MKIQPYTQPIYPKGSEPIDGTESNQFLFTFGDPNKIHVLTAYYLEYRENILGATTYNTGWVTSSTPQHTFVANTFTNGKNYAWRVKVKDNNSTPIESVFSDWVSFKTSARPTTNITYPINDNDIVPSDIPTFQHEFVDSGGQLQQSYQYKLYSDLDVLLWTSDLLTDYDNLVVPPKGLLQQSTYYKIEVTVTDTDGLSATSTKRRFLTNFPSSTSNSSSFSVTVDNDNAKVDMKWATTRSILGTYVGSGERYLPCKFGNGIQVSEYGEKVYWNIAFPELWYIPNFFKLSDINKNGTILFLYRNEYSYIRLKYENSSQRFIIEKSVNGSVRTIGSATVVINNDDIVGYVLQQTINGLELHYNVNGGIITILREWL